MNIHRRLNINQNNLLINPYQTSQVYSSLCECTLQFHLKTFILFLSLNQHLWTKDYLLKKWICFAMIRVGNGARRKKKTVKNLGAIICINKEYKNTKIKLKMRHILQLYLFQKYLYVIIQIIARIEKVCSKSHSLQSYPWTYFLIKNDLFIQQGNLRYRKQWCSMCKIMWRGGSDTGIVKCEIAQLMIQQYQMKKLVNVDFKIDQGVILSWNYLDLTKRTKYFHHIIVLLTSNVEQATQAIEGYIRHIKLGDLYTVIYSSKGIGKITEWREKTNRVPSGDKKYFREEMLVSFSFEQASPIIQKQIQQIGEPTIVNFVLQKQAEISNLKNKIKERQIHQKIKFVSTIFSEATDNHISISQGINMLSLSQPFVFQFFQHYLNQMAIQFAHLAITCRNGEISSCNQGNWRNTCFNKIERSYYGPSIRYTKDVLHFLNSKVIYQGTYDLDLDLTLRCFGGATYTAEKKINISFNHSEMYNRTVCPPKKSRLYYSTEDIQIEENPYQSETLIFFEKMSETRHKNLDA